MLSKLANTRSIQFSTVAAITLGVGSFTTSLTIWPVWIFWAVFTGVAVAQAARS